MTAQTLLQSYSSSSPHVQLAIIQDCRANTDGK
jgi:hypothetical protein